LFKSIITIFSLFIFGVKKGVKSFMLLFFARMHHEETSKQKHSSHPLTPDTLLQKTHTHTTAYFGALHKRYLIKINFVVLQLMEIKRNERNLCIFFLPFPTRSKFIFGYKNVQMVFFFH
jgi:hypothetical protein